MPGLWKVDCYSCFQHKELDRKECTDPVHFLLATICLRWLEKGQRSKTRCPQLHARVFPISMCQILCVAYLWEHTPLLNYKSFSPQEWKSVTSIRSGYLYEPWLASVFLVRIALAIQAVVFHIITHIWLLFCWSSGYLSLFLSGNIHIH